MASIRLATDRIGSVASDKKVLESVAELLRKEGHTVTTHGRDPNAIQSVMRKQSNQCDIMIQIAGGRCIGTLCDFYIGLNSGYYHATKGAILYFKKSMDWKVHRSGDDNFSTKGGKIKTEVDKWIGKKLLDVYADYKGKMYWGQGNTADEMVKSFLANYGGSNSTSNNENNGGTSILELIKQVCSDIDKYGPELTITGDTANIKRTNPNTAIPLTPNMITTGQISFNDYDNSTPNENGGYKDTFLIDRFGVISMDDVDSSWKDQVLLMAQRGHGHSIELKCIISSDYIAGKWVRLTLPELGIYERPYFITKHSYDEEMVMSLTLEPGPPSLYVDIQEETIEEDTTETEET